MPNNKWCLFVKIWNLLTIAFKKQTKEMQIKIVLLSENWANSFQASHFRLSGNPTFQSIVLWNKSDNVLC